MLLSRPELLLRGLFGSVALQQPGAESTSVTPVAAEGCAVAQGLIGYLAPCCCSGAIMHLEPYRSKWHILLLDAMVTSGLGLQLGLISGSLTLLQPGTVLMFVVLVVTVPLDS